MSKKTRMNAEAYNKQGAAKVKSTPTKESLEFSNMMRRILFVIVFMSGGSLMALELSGSRVIAPTFGSSVYTWGSLIGIFLLALSIGYFFGGKLADKLPSFGLLTIALALSGGLVIAIPYYSHPLCAAFSDMGQKWGSCIVSLILFAPASILMGIVSPLAIRLQTKAVESVGGVAGSLYAVSTLGSIVGTFLTSFWLLELCGISVLTRGIGIILLLAALLSLLLSIKMRSGLNILLMIISVPILVAGATVSLAVSTPLPIDLNGAELLDSQDSAYNTLFVLDSGNERLLQFNERKESGFYLDRPNISSFEYTSGMHAAFAYNKNIKNILLIGGGGAALPIEFVCCFEHEVVFDSIEIDSGVIEYSRKYFINYAIDKFASEGLTNQRKKLWADRIANNINLIEADGRLYVRECKKKYDLVLIDAYLGGRIPFHLTTSEFFKDVANCLTDDGIMAMNIISGFRGETGRIFQSLHLTLSEYFPHIMIVPLLEFLPNGNYSYDETVSYQAIPRNMILISTKKASMAKTGAEFKETMKALFREKFYVWEVESKVSRNIESAGTIDEYTENERTYYIYRAKEHNEKIPKIPPIINPKIAVRLTDEFSPVDVWSGLTMLYRR